MTTTVQDATAGAATTATPPEVARPRGRAMRKTIVGYIPSRSPIYRLHPASRLVLYLVTSVIPLFIEAPEINLLVVALTLVLFRFANVRMTRLKMFVPMFLTVFVILGLTYTLFPRETGPGGGTVLFSIGPVTGYFESLMWALATYCRIIALVLASIFYFSTNRESDILVGLRTLGVPFVVSYFVGLTLRSVGIFLEDYAVIKEAEIARGLDTRNLGLVGKVKHFAMNLVPLFTLSIRRSEDISIGLHAKGTSLAGRVGGARRPDYLRSRFVMNPRDWVLVVALVLALVGVATLRFTTPWLGLVQSATYAALSGLL